MRNPKTVDSVLKTKGIWSAEFITGARRYEITGKRVKSSVLIFFNKRGPFSTTKEKVYYALFNEWLYEIRVSANESYYTGEELDILVKEKIYKDNKKRGRDSRRERENEEKRGDSSTFKKRKSARLPMNSLTPEYHIHHIRSE